MAAAPDAAAAAEAGKSRFTSRLLLPDDEIRELGVAQHEIELYRRMAFKQGFAIESWYNLGNLAAHTYPTSWIDLSYDTGQALLKMCHAKYDWFSGKIRDLSDVLTPEEAKMVDRLEADIDGIIKPWASAGGAFIKLSTRSPKDVPMDAWDDKDMQDTVMAELRRYPLEQARQPRTQAIAFMAAAQLFVQVRTGAFAVYLLTRSNRVQADLAQVALFPRQLWNMRLVLRQWSEETPRRAMWEFRCFVHNNSLNAITQYFDFLRFPDLIDNKERIQQCLQAFFSTHVRDTLAASHGSYVIDLYITADWNVQMIELNPFHHGAGAGLFSWKTDRELFLNGPLEFRLQQHDAPDPVDAVIHPKWQRWINKQLDAWSRAESRRGRRCLLM